MVPVGRCLILGANAAPGLAAAPAPDYWDGSDRYMEMSTALWRRLCETCQPFVAECDLFRQVETCRDGVTFIEEVALTEKERLALTELP